MGLITFKIEIINFEMKIDHFKLGITINFKIEFISFEMIIVHFRLRIMIFKIEIIDFPNEIIQNTRRNNTIQIRDKQF